MAVLTEAPVAAEVTLRTCATMEVHHRLLEQQPDYMARLLAAEDFTEQYLRLDAFARRTGVFRIPVVVHVVYKTDVENVSDECVASQIEALNRDFRATNDDRENVPDAWKDLVADSQIEFFLATHGPDGRPTPGITRTETTLAAFAASQELMKSKATGGADAWPSEKYLNIWVCSLKGATLGFGQFPGGPPSTDGVVILNRVFGTVGNVASRFALGRTATHEVGHWLNLHHIWGDKLDCTGTDEVEDTPIARAPNKGTPVFPHVSCGTKPNGDMFMNYMDYVDDKAMYMFTLGQAARMSATLEGPRSGIATVVP